MVTAVLRFVLRLMALVVVSVAGPLILLGLLDVVRDGGGGLVCTNCAPTTPPIAQFDGRVESRYGDTVVFRVDRVRQGAWTTGRPVRASRRDFAPWRRYRVTVFERGDVQYVSTAVAPKTLDIGPPTGLEAFDALPWYDSAAIAAVPVFLLAANYLRVQSRRQSRREKHGVMLSGLRPRRRRRRRDARRPPRTVAAR